MNHDIEGFKVVVRFPGKPHLKCRARKCTWTSRLRPEQPLETLIAQAIAHRRQCLAAVVPIMEVELQTNFQIRRIRT